MIRADSNTKPEVVTRASEYEAEARRLEEEIQMIEERVEAEGLV